MKTSKKHSIPVVHNDKIMTLSEVCRLTNTNYNTIYYRIKSRGMTPLEAFSNKFNPFNK